MANKVLFIILLVNLFSLFQVFADISAVLAERESIRIAAFYYLDNASPRLRELISEQLVPAAISYYQATLKVNRFKNRFVLDHESLEGCAAVEPQKSMEKGVEADLVLLVFGYKNNQYGSDALATAKVCQVHSGTNRPATGLISFNLDQELDTTQIGATTYESQLLLTLHEIGHILGFNRNLFDYYINPLTGERLLNTTMRKEVNGMMITILTLDPLTKRLRDYFACPTLEGAYLEQQGDGGSVNSHFERRVFMNELMTSVPIRGERVSQFFLALLEGTGWYTVNYEMSEPMFWGKGKGCEFLDTKCTNYARKTNFPDHFCTELRKRSCSYDQAAYGYCGTFLSSRDASLEPAFDYWRDGSVLSLDRASDNCPYRAPLVSCEHSRAPLTATNIEYFGPRSACFTGNLNAEEKETPFCFKQSCQKLESDQYVVNIEIEDRTIVCEKEGPISVDDYDDEGYINCPDPVSFCTLVTPYFCRRGCMGRGTCVNNQCVCNEGYYGSDCGKRNVEKTQAEGLPVEYYNYMDVFYKILPYMIVLFSLVFNIKSRKNGQNDKKRKEEKEQNIVSPEESSHLKTPNMECKEGENQDVTVSEEVSTEKQEKSEF